ncbi:MAG: hypothetical protein ABIE68_00010, partial [bacterium]
NIPVYECSYTPSPGNVTNNNDCDDTNANIYEGQTFYADNDQDGLGDPNNSLLVCSLIVPTGYVTNADDLNDADFDNDGVSTDVDCNDQDTTVSDNITVYADNDGDSYGAGAAIEMCVVVPPAGHSLNNTDCDDTNAAVNQETTFYQDADGDGLGNPAVTQEICTDQTPVGWVTEGNDQNDYDFDNDGVPTGQDCNDNDNTISDNQVYYADNDADGLGDPNNFLEVCSYEVPEGYVTNSDDLDDNDNGQVEDVVTVGVSGTYLYVYVNGVEVGSKRVFSISPTSVDYEVTDYYNDGVYDIVVTGVYFRRIGKVVSLQFDGSSVDRIQSRYLWLNPRAYSVGVTMDQGQNIFNTLFGQSLVTWQMEQNGTFSEYNLIGR